MGEPPGLTGARVSLTRHATTDDVEAFAVAWRAIYGRMRQSRAA
jgi:cysteine sulfinate desulfinase/cysteine desulfurase-like protein